MALANKPAAGLVAAFAIILTLSTKFDAYCGSNVVPGIRDLRNEIKPPAGKEVEITSEELLAKLKKFGAKGAILYEGDIFLTDEKYDASKRYSDVNTLVFLRINDQETMEQILAALPPGREMADGSRYMSV